MRLQAAVRHPLPFRRTVISTDRLYQAAEISGNKRQQKPSQSLETGRQAAVFPTGWQMCTSVNVCVLHHVGLNFADTASPSRAQFDLSSMTDAMFIYGRMNGR